jgi:hypothetical protein
MPEPAALGPRRLWRAVVRPLVEEGWGDIVCDISDAEIAEGLLATTEATLHTVARGEVFDELSQVYRDRFVFHRDAAAAWEAANGCRLAVLDIQRASLGHVDALCALVENDGPAPPVLIQGLHGRAASDTALADFTGRGWAVIELPGFEQIRLVLPGGQKVLDGSTLDAILERLSAGSPATNDPHVSDDASTKIEQLRTRVRVLEQSVAKAQAERELAERRRAASEDVVATLRLINDKARADLDHSHGESESLRRLVDSSHADARAAHARTARMARAQAAVRDDLMRLQASQSWRLGHRLGQLARILTFRKPGRTNAVSKAIERLDASAPSGEDHR